MNEHGTQPIFLDGAQKAELLLAEYKAMRDEIVKRMEMRNQFVIWGLIAVGGFLSLVTNKDFQIIAPLLFPLLGFCLAWGWMHNDVRIEELGRFIQTHIESRVPEVMMWQQYKDAVLRARSNENRTLGGFQFPSGMAFLAIQIVPVLAVMPRIEYSGLVIFLLLMDGLLAILTVSMVMRRSFVHFMKRLGGYTA